jgi:hypothetical protein
MNRFRGVAVIPFAVLTHIDQHCAWIVLQALAGLLDRDFTNPRANRFHQFQKAG